MNRGRSKRLMLACFLLCSSLNLACQERPATRLQCEEIFERLIVLELREMGFKDSALSERWVNRLRRKYRAELEECVGKEIPDHAMTCLKSAKSAEVLSHSCLR